MSQAATVYPKGEVMPVRRMNLFWYIAILSAFIVCVWMVIVRLSPKESSKAMISQPRACLVCGRKLSRVEELVDNTSKPSRNLSVWNRSDCGNLMIDSDSLVCSHDWYAYSPVLKKWSLSVEDPNGFSIPLDERIRDFPFPPPQSIRSRIVYSQEIVEDTVTHSVRIWCKTDERYLTKLLANRKNVSIEIERNRLPGESYVIASVNTKRSSM